MEKLQLVWLTAANFNAEVREHQGSVLVLIEEGSHAPSRHLRQVVEEITAKHNGLLKTGCLNTDSEEGQEMARELRGFPPPTLIFFRNGQELDRLPGDHYLVAAFVARWLDGCLKTAA